MAQSADLPRFVISKVDDVTRSPQETEHQQTSAGGATEVRHTDTPVNGNVNHTSHFSGHVKQQGRRDLAINRDPDMSPGHFRLLEKFPFRFLHGVGHFPLPPPPSANLQYKAIYR